MKNLGTIYKTSVRMTPKPVRTHQEISDAIRKTFADQMKKTEQKFEPELIWRCFVNYPETCR